MFDWLILHASELAVIGAFLLCAGLTAWASHGLFWGRNEDCTCLEYVGDDENCPEHGHLYEHYRKIAHDQAESKKNEEAG